MRAIPLRSVPIPGLSLENRVPELFRSKGDLLMVGCSPIHLSLARGFVDRGYVVTLLETRRPYRTSARRNSAFARVLECDLKNLSSIASTQGLQWDLALWWDDRDAVPGSQIKVGLRELQLVTRKLVVVGARLQDPIQGALERAGFVIERSDMVIGCWYGAQWEPKVPVVQVVVTKPVDRPIVVRVPPQLPQEQGEVTAIVVNFNTPALTRTAIMSLRTAYPKLPIIVIDNGSTDSSELELIYLLQEVAFKLVLNGENIGHGPALHQAMLMCTTPYVLTLDSDCIVHRTGFVEAMLDCFQKNSNLYAVGWQRWVDRFSGVPMEWYLEHPDLSRFMRYIHPSCALFDRTKYMGLSTFFHHGAPCLDNMRSAVDNGLDLEDFPVANYVEHLVAGTRRRYEGRWDPKSSERPGPWNADEHLPI